MRRLILLLLLALGLPLSAVTTRGIADSATADGEWSWPSLRAGKTYTFTLSGSFGGGTATLGYIDASGSFASFGRSLTAAGTYTAVLPSSATAGQGTPAISISGATSPAILLTTTKADASSADVTNASVAAAIADDPAASRNAALAMPVESPAPRASAKFAAIADAASVGTGQTVSIFATGDSLGTRVFDPLIGTLGQHVSVVGIGMERLRYVVSAGTVVTPGANSTANFQPTIWDTGRVWDMSDASAMVIGPFLGGADVQPFYCKEVRVVAAKQPGGGDLVVEYALNYPTGSPTWTSLGTIDTDGTAGEAAAATYTVASNRWMVLRVSASGGAVDFVGALMLNTDASGMVVSSSANGGLRMNQANLGSSSVRAAVFAMVDPDLTIVQFREGEGEISQSDSNTYFDNLLTAEDEMDILLMSQHRQDPTDATAAVTNAIWETSAATRDQITILPTEELIGGLYGAYAAGFRDPSTGLADEAGNIGIHLANGAWMRIANRIISEVLPQSGAAASFVRYYKAGTQERFALAEQTPGQNGGSRIIDIPGDTGYDQSLGFTWRRGTGYESYWRLTRAADNAATGPRGLKLDFQGESTTITPMSVDSAGCWSFKRSFSSTPFSAYSDEQTAMAVETNLSNIGVLNLNHTHASATWIQRWQHQDSTKAEMREDGELNLKTITTPAAYADDTAAGAAGIPVGGIYRKTDGTVVWRQS